MFFLMKYTKIKQISFAAQSNCEIVYGRTMPKLDTVLVKILSVKS